MLAVKVFGGLLLTAVGLFSLLLGFYAFGIGPTLLVTAALLLGANAWMQRRWPGRWWTTPLSKHL